MDRPARRAHRRRATTRATRRWSRPPRRACGGVPGWWWRPRMRVRCATPPPGGSPRCRRDCGCPTSSRCAATSPPAWPRCTSSTPALQMDLAALADELDAEALRNSAGRELFTNPAKALANGFRAQRGAGRRLGGHPGAGPARLLRRCCGSRHRAVAAAGLADALVALRSGTGRVSAPRSAMSRALPRRRDRRAAAGPVARPRADAGIRARRGQRRAWPVLDDVDIVGAEDVPDADGCPAGQPGRPEQQLAMLAVRLEMAAVYLRLAG